MFCLEYPNRSKPHKFQQRQKCDNDDKTMAGRLEKLDKILAAKEAEIMEV